MNTEIIKKQTVEDICSSRDEALRLLEEGIEKIREAYSHVSAATSKRGGYWINHELERLDLERSENGVYHRDTVENMRRRLDADTWRSIYARTGLGDNFDTQARNEFEEQLSKNPPEITVENVTATCFGMAARQGEVFSRSVHNLFRRLSRSHKSNSGFSFGDRLVFCNAVHGFNCDWYDVVRDLERVVLTIYGDTPPDRQAGLIPLLNAELKEAKKGLGWTEKTAGEFEDNHFNIRWFKNGNLHIRIKSQETINQLNRIIADETLYKKR